MEHVVSIGPSGAVRSMHNDKFSLGFLGKQSIDRASDICWDEEEQNWGIWFNVGGTYEAPSIEYSGFGSYEEARDFEVKVMNQCIQLEMPPTDPHVKRWAATHRR